MNYFDIHSHLNFHKYDDDRDKVIANMKEEGVGTITVGTCLATSKEALELAEAHAHLYACIGLHPVDEKEKVFFESEFEKLVSHPKVVAIGETGLDYFHADEDDKDRQVENFRAQIEFALKHDLPLMIHCREAYDDTLSILEEYKDRGVRGNMHFFAGDIDIADRVLNLGFTISFTGVITFTEEYKELVRYVPLERMMAETDAPFVAPAPMRGRRNEPAYVKYVYEAIAEIRGEGVKEIEQILTDNAQKFFRVE